MPPRASQPLATGWPSPAPRRSSSAPLPADHGPRNDPRMPPAATVARSGSRSNHSATRSATAIGIQRRRRYASVLPSARNRRPAFSISITSPADGPSIDGGGDALSARSTPETRAKASRKRGHAAASFGEKAAISRTARSRSDHSTSARPSSVGAHASAAGRTICRPCFSSPSARTIAGSRAAVCARVDDRTPATISRGDRGSADRARTARRRACAARSSRASRRPPGRSGRRRSG